MSDSVTCTACGKLYVGNQCPDCGRFDDTNALTIEQIGDEDASVSIVSVELEENQAALVVLKGATPGETLILEGLVITVGRDAGCDLFLDDITVSRKHAEIQSSHTSDGYLWFVLDTTSLNGTYINREVITDKMLLNNGDEIQFGKYKFTFLLPGEK
jgi:pSer/pThr/pTyr-binding forkhead associated (FHA) protein